MNNISKGQKKKKRERASGKKTFYKGRTYQTFFFPDSNCKWYLFREALLLGMIFHGHHFTR